VEVAVSSLARAMTKERMPRMLFPAADLVSFWISSWSAPFRAACLWIDPPPLRLGSACAPPPAPRWLRPLCVQRWVAQAITARLDWLKQHPETPYRFGRESEPCWQEAAWATYDRACLRTLNEETLRWLFGVEVERLLRLAQESPTLVGQGDWTKAALGVTEHVAQLYHELRRRCKAGQARAMLREELQRFVAWEASKEDGESPSPNHLPE
jgi:hypothetical protein